MKLLTFFGIILLFFYNCEENEVLVRSGFKDPSTFVIIATGRPKPEEKDQLKRRYEAKSAALLLAQKEMTDSLKGKIILDQEITEISFNKKDTCTLIYTVKIKP